MKRVNWYFVLSLVLSLVLWALIAWSCMALYGFVVG
jgi:hypothetical protein